MSTVPYGAWPSPLSPRAASAARISVSALQVAPDGSWWWSESRPEEGGRQVVVRVLPGGHPEVVSPGGVNVRTRVHEYGGVAFTVAGDELVYSSLEDEALWAFPAARAAAPAAAPAATGAARRVTAPAPPGERHRYGEPHAMTGSHWAEWMVCLRERHHAGGVDDEVVALWRASPVPQAPVVLARGRDFYGAVRPEPGGRRLAWTCWDHPDMPWDGSELWVAAVDRDDEGAPRLGRARHVAGGRGESVGQPTWAADGSLFFTSDRHGWWQPYRWEGTGDGRDGDARRLSAEEAEFHAPDWVLGQATLAPLPDGRLACRFRRHGRDAVGVLDPADGSLVELPQPCVSVQAVRADGPGTLAVVGVSADEPVAVHALSVPPADEAPDRATTRAVVVHRPRPSSLPPGWTAVAEPMSFPTSGGVEAHLLYFAPAAPDVQAPAGSSPPLVVYCHGGPTGAAEGGFDLSVQLWTTRGFAVALVDYRGSSGYGRVYRDLLHGAWGVADAEDATAAASFLADGGLADGTRMLVRGGSAGGFTALRALRSGGPFAGALVSYGVTDLRALALDTHKFESRYLDGLIGPWPEAAERYEERSPALHPEEIDGAVLLLQGEDDPVVPPDQARRMAEALRTRGMRCDLELFAGEGHGFRRAETLARAAELELAFAASVLDLPVRT